MAELDFEESTDEPQDSIKMFTGDSVSVMSIVSEMFNIYKSQFEEGKSPIKYLDEGGEARNILEVISFIIIFYFLFYLNSMALVYFIPHSSGDFLDILGRDNLRSAAEKSKRDLLFYFPDDAVKDYDITIPAWFVASTEDDEGLEFETIVETVLVAGQNSVLVPAQSIYGGSEYNVGSNRVTVLEEELDDLEVTNPNPFIGGTDDEDDESYRAKLLAEKRGVNFGSVEWYKDEAEKIDGVHDAKIVNCENGNHTLGIIINPPVDDIISNVINFFSSPGNIPGGNSHYIYGVTPVSVDLIIENITFSPDINPQDGRDEIQTRLLNFFNNRMIETDFSRSDILTILSQIEGLIDYSLLAPAQDMECEPNSVFVAGTIDLRS
ncbi:baseplate J-like protein [Methanobrevibacter cuticularis]|uniref:Baseplate J-like protein n=1 Tax=Methanobrevibacter cuticularis TaxID=47311 RepID=A0A166EHE8_9EURY|nr:baseplate J/gp47 family protein [Methanobrevibacter cuticularis]KZX16656.1 baseplate J-like protein [Methanobrevibacter cuticularis]